MYYTIYKVERGDSVGRIIQKFGTSGSSIKRLNPSADIVEGERLLIAAELGVAYVVKPFDTMESIARENGFTVAELTALNELYEVYLGQSILLPKR